MGVGSVIACPAKRSGFRLKWKVSGVYKMLVEILAFVIRTTRDLTTEYIVDVGLKFGRRDKTTG